MEKSILSKLISLDSVLWFHLAADIEIYVHILFIRPKG